MSKPGVDPCMGLLMSRTFRRVLFFFAPVSLFDWVAVSSPRPVQPSRPRAGAVKAGRRSMLAARSRVARPRLDGFERDGRLGAVGTTVGGELASGADQSRHNLVFGGPEDPNHDAAMRIGREAPKRRTHSTSRH